MTVKLDGDVIMGEIVNDKRYHSQGLGSVEDLRSVCSCTCLSCHPSIFSRKNQRHLSPPALYSDYYLTPPRSRPGSVHEMRLSQYTVSDYGLITPLHISRDMSMMAGSLGGNAEKHHRPSTDGDAVQIRF